MYSLSENTKYLGLKFKGIKSLMGASGVNRNDLIQTLSLKIHQKVLYVI